MRRHLLLPALSASRRSSWCQTCPRRFPGRFSGTCNIVLRTATQSKAGGRSPLRWAPSRDEVGPALRLRLWARSSHVSAFSSWQPLASVSWVQICPSAHPASSPRAHATSLSVFKPELLLEIPSMRGYTALSGHSDGQGGEGQEQTTRPAVSFRPAGVRLALPSLARGAVGTGRSPRHGAAPAPAAGPARALTWYFWIFVQRT